MLRRALAAIGCLGVFAFDARAQCPSWSPGFHQPGLDDRVDAMIVFDDGSGPGLYIGGDFKFAGPVAAAHVAKWDGSDWSAFGEGVGNSVHALAFFDSGNGAELYAGGSFAHAGGAPVFGIARWDGSDWLALDSGLDLPVTSLVVFDDGSGPALYVGGLFNYASGIASKGVARWNGSAWSSVGGGSGLNVRALAIYDDGNGEALYAGGYTGGASSVLMKWDGATWTPIPAPLAGGYSIEALLVHDDGSGAALFAGGDFEEIGGVAASKVAKWDGSNWSELGSGVTGWSVYALGSFDDGAGAQLFVGGQFTHAGGQSAPNIARWDGATWSALGGGTNYNVRTLQAFDAGNGPVLWVGGEFTSAGALAVSRMAGWDGAVWVSAEPEGQGVILEGISRVEVLAEIDGGGVPSLYAGGYFHRIGSAFVNSVARWDGVGWSPLGTGAGPVVYALAGFDDGSGPALFAAGGFVFSNPTQFFGIAKWDGGAWSQVGGGLFGSSGPASALALVVFDDGSGQALFAGGSFTFAGGAPANRIAMWDGTSWSPLGSGTNGGIEALAVYDDGSGPALYAGGNFTSAGGIAANRVAKWDGTNWSALGSGVDDRVYALTVHDDGSGPALYAGGHFQNSGGTAIGYVARWDGASWTGLGGGTNDYVKALVSYDDGSGRALFAGGHFSTAGGASARRIAKWDGSSWSALGSGLGLNASSCHALAVFHDGATPQGSLYAGGDFPTADGAPSLCIARWTDPCACQAMSYCTSGITSSGCVPAISGVGTATASNSTDFTIEVAGLEGAKTGHIFYGLSGPHAAPWGASSHYLCVKAPSQRTGTQPTGGSNGQCDGTMTLDWDAYVASHPTSLGVPFNAGQSVWAQAYFRDPPGPKTTALSNGLAFSICP